MQEQSRQARLGQVGRSNQQFESSPQVAEHIQFEWKSKTLRQANRSVLRRLRRKLGGLVAYGATFYRTAAK
jgi:hypothetical protein